MSLSKPKFRLLTITIAILLAGILNINFNKAALAESSNGDYLNTSNPSSNPNSHLRHPKFYFYVQTGETVRASFIKNSFFYNSFTEITEVDFTLTNPEGWTQTITIDGSGSVGDSQSFTGVPTATVDGVWELAIDYKSPTGKRRNPRLSWDIGVYSGSTLIPGRFWTNLLSIAQPPQENSVPTLSKDYYFLSEDAYLYKYHVNNFNGLYSFLEASAFGLVFKDTCNSAYQSKFGTGGDINYALNCGGQFKMFFAPPATDLPDQVELLDGTTTSLNRTVKDTTISNIKLTPTNPSTSPAGIITADIANYNGNLTIEIDTNNDGVFTDSIDHQIQQGHTSGTLTYNWDGKDGQGHIIKPTQPLSIRIKAGHKGEIHFVRSDVERSESISVERMNGLMNDRFTIYYNDSQLDTNRRGNINVNPANASINGVDSSVGVHGWDIDGCVFPNGNPSYGNDANLTPQGSSYGDHQFIDDWAFDKNSAVTSTNYLYSPKITVWVDEDGNNLKDPVVNLEFQTQEEFKGYAFKVVTTKDGVRTYVYIKNNVKAPNTGLGDLSSIGVVLVLSIISLIGYKGILINKKA